jgi:hypothetical protein
VFSSLQKEVDEEQAWASRGPGGEPMDASSEEEEEEVVKKRRISPRKGKSEEPKTARTPEDAGSRRVALPPSSAPVALMPVSTSSPRKPRGRIPISSGELAIEDGEMPEVPQDSFITQDAAVKYIEDRETEDVKTAKRIVSEKCRQMKEALVASIQMANEYDVSFSQVHLELF